MNDFREIASISDIWSATPQCLRTQLQEIILPRYHGSWSSTFQETLQSCDNLDVILKAQIVNCEKSEQWELTTAQGIFIAPHLIITQNLWSTHEWLPESYFPPPILDVCLKSKPTSQIAIICHVENSEDLPRRAYSPAEGVLMEHSAGVAIWTLPLDFERSLEAPKAVRVVAKAKRGCKKILSYFSHVVIKDEHIALNPAAKTYPKTPRDFQVVGQKLSKPSFHDLHFGGTCYGSSTPSENLRNSINYVLAHLQEALGENNNDSQRQSIISRNSQPDQTESVTTS